RPSRHTSRWARLRMENLEDRLVPAPIIVEYPQLPGNPGPKGITRGPQGLNDLWITELNTSSLQEISTNGALVGMPIAINIATHITPGPSKDPSALYINNSGIHGGVTRLGFGLPQPFSNNDTPYDITAGPDGNVWYAGQNPDAIVKFDAMAHT